METITSDLGSEASHRDAPGASAGTVDAKDQQDTDVLYAPVIQEPSPAWSSGAVTQKVVDVTLGHGVIIRDFVNLYGCAIGDNSRIGAFVEIQAECRVGRNVKVSSHTFICTGVVIEDNVFIGHNVSFINDRYPRATVNGRPQTADDWVSTPTLVKEGASVGTGATILCGITIGEHAIVGAGSVVTRDVPPYTVVAGNPARPLRAVPELSNA